MPVIIHSREAVEDTMRLLNQYRPKGVVHLFLRLGGDRQRGCCGWGCTSGSPGSLPLKRPPHPGGGGGRAMDRLLIETDCPTWPRSPYRGKAVRFHYLPRMAEAIAAIKGITAQEVADATCRNACRLLKSLSAGGLGRITGNTNCII